MEEQPRNKRKMGNPIFLGLPLVLGFFVSCGSNPSEQMSSVIVNISLEQTSLDADTAVWQDTNNDGTCDVYSIESSAVNVSIDVEPLPNIPEGVNPSPVEVDRVDIVYTPADSVSPPIQTNYELMGVTVKSGNPKTIPFEILSQTQKRDLIDKYSLFCRNPNLNIYSYYVTLRFNVREVYSNETRTIEKQIFMKVSDFGPETCKCF